MVLTFGDHRLDIKRRELRRGTELIDLEPKVFDLLAFLVEHRDRVVSKDDLLQEVWGGRIVSESTVTTRINAVRRALGDDGTAQRLVRTFTRKGIRFVGEVTEMSDPAAPTASDSPSRTPTAADKPSIAVLPFQNMSGDPEQEYFADGMVEDIITALSRFKELFVIARNSSFVYKGRAVEIQQVARELGVRYVLEGGVRKAGNRVRITGQLIDAATRAHLWADRFDGALEDVFDLQDRITESVVGALQPTLRQAEIERARRKPPASLDAYDHLLRAMPLLIANSAAEAATAVQPLADALRLSPDYPYAHALMAIAYGQILRSAGGAEREQMRLKAVAHARRALEVAGDDSTVLAHAGFILLVTDQDVAAARAALDKAVALNANSASAYGYRALVLAMSGEPEPAIENATRALRLSPLDSTNYLPQMAVVIARLGLGQYAEAVAWAHKAIESAPPRYPMSYAFLIVAECKRGNIAEAERQVRRLAAILPGFEPGTLARLFDVFPEPLRSNSVAVLRDARLVPAAS